MANKNPESTLEDLGRRLFHICHRIGVSQGNTTFPKKFGKADIRSCKALSDVLTFRSLTDFLGINEASKHDGRLIYKLKKFNEKEASSK